MTEQHKPEHRISAVEKRITHLEGDIQEHAADTAEELKTIREEIKQGHLQIGESIDTNTNSLMKEMRAMEGRIVASLKNDMVAMETRLIETMKQLLQQKSDG